MQTATAAPATRRPRRAASPERWQAALARAIANGVAVRQLAGTGEWIAASGSDAGVCYRTDGVGCECPAAQLGGDPVCQHRAAYWHALGLLDPDPDPEPEPPAPAASPAYLVTMDGTPYASHATREEAEREAFRLRRWASTATRIAVAAA